MRSSSKVLALAAASLMTVAVQNEPAVREVKITKMRREPVDVRRVYRKSNKFNRSRHWPYAESYADARAMSPYPNRPVR